MRHALLAALILLPSAAPAQGLLDGMGGAWAIGSTASCVRSPYELTVTSRGANPVLSFRDQAGRVNDERVDSQREDGVSTTTLRSPDVPPGTRWTYAAMRTGAFVVHNLSNGKQFTIVRCPSSVPRPAAAGDNAPAFSDPTALVAWLLQQSSSGTNFTDDAKNADVFSPGLRAALRASAARSRREGAPPCGANGDIIRDSQETGRVENLRLSTQAAAPDRATVAASFDVDGYHRDRRFMAVNLDGAWKLENVIEADGSSLRRSLDCR
ncbi:MAG TPA: hypothetical protein VGC15_13600 [Acetobacteraceae bacterium]